MLAGHAGDAMNSLRVGRDAVAIPKVLLSVAVIVQADAMHQAYKSRVAKGRGFLARFCTCAPWTKLGYRNINPDPVPADLRERAWHKRIRTMLLWRMPTDGEPVAMRFDDKGQRLFDEFRQAHEARLAPIKGDLGQREKDGAWGSKLPGTLARFAGVMQCLIEASAGGMASPKVITAETVRAALSWAEWLIDANRHAERVALASGEETDPEELRQKVSELIWAKDGELSVRQLQTHMRREFPDADLARAALQRLVDDHEGFWKPQPDKAGRKSEVFRFHEADEP